MLKKIIKILNQKEGKSCPRKEILQELKKRGYTIGDRKMRKIISDWRMRGGLIGSSHNRGYFIIDDEEKLKEAEAEYLRKAKTMLKIANVLRDSYNARYNKQLKFFDIKEV